MYKVAVIGDSQSVLAFRAVGLKVFFAENAASAASILHRISRENYAVIFITEQLAAHMQGDIARYNDTASVAVIPIPSREGALGIGQSQLRTAVERAVGVDILSDSLSEGR